METGKRNWGIISILSLLLVKEEMGLLVAAIGLMYIFRKQVKTGILLTVAGLFGFYILINSIIPTVSSQNNYIHYGYGSLGETPAEVAKSVINNPVAGFRSLIEPKIKLEQVGASIISFGGLPLLSPVGLIPVFQNYAVRFIDDRNTHRWLNNNHYSAHLGHCWHTQQFWHSESLNHGSCRLRFIWQQCQLWLLLVLRLPVWSLFKSQLYFTPQWVKNIDSIVKLVPANASVAANNSVFPAYFPTG